MKQRILAAGAVVFMTTTTAVADTEIKILSINRDSETWRALYDDVVADYNANNPDVTVVVEYMEDESFKQKLPTLLQSAAAPDMFFSWSGGVFYEQAEQGFLGALPDSVVAEWQQELSPGGMAALSHNGKFYGAPEASQNVAIWYNKDIAAQLGVDPTTIKTYDDLLEMVKTAKAGDVTPFVVGGQDKWPLHFFYSFLAMRIMGKEGMAASAAGENGGFNNEDWIRAGQEYMRLIELEPFQNGFMGVKYDQATGLWGDGGSLFHLMGDWDLGASRGAASNGGLTNDQLGVIPFPMVEGGKGAVTDTLGGASGFVLTSKASPEAIDFLKVFMGVEAQKRAAREATYIPTVPSAGDLVEDPILKQFAAIGGASTYHQLFLDQYFGSSLGGAINDVSAQMATGDITPEAAAELLEDTRAFQ
ncbi:extracellular solute-binding protein [Ruegeria sp. SCPT10]|uniref:extracellular solute-binding protein n=1 Tax=Ruegeria sp. SCP10 TaxID=3141377 RepID=UPI00333B91AD